MSAIECIGTSTLSSTASVVTFSSIPATYTDLIVVGTASLTGGANSGDTNITFNNDTGGTTYSSTYLRGDGTAISYRRTNYPYVADLLMAFSGNFRSFHLNILSYANTNVFKTFIGQTNIGGIGRIDTNVSLWRNTAAINRVDITPYATTFVAGSTFSLWGVK